MKNIRIEMKRVAGEKLVVDVASPDEHLVTNAAPFHDRARAQVEDPVMRRAVAKAQDVIGANRARILEELGDVDLWRDRAASIRDYVLENLDALLSQLADKVEENGGHVFFAKTKEEATEYILGVCREKNARKVVKSKSMVTEEIGMNHALEAAGIEVLETDLGEYILQVAGDKPSHVVVPAIHRDRTQIRAALAEKLGYDGPDTPEAMTAFVRERLRPDFMDAEVGVTGCNFAVPETGSVCLVTNEGNARLVTTLPKTHIAVMGMERIAPTFEEVDVLITMLARSAVGARLTGYNTWLTGPRAADEADGPEEFHLVILDNGRSEILGSAFREILRCIRCGACMNTCPCYREIGGHGYGSIYPGPLGAVITPLLGGYEKFGDLPYVCTLCKACETVCPVEIPLADLIMKHRRSEVEQGLRPRGERLATELFGWVNGRPGLWDLSMKTAARAGGLLKTGEVPFAPGELGKWYESRNLPVSDGEAFRSWFEKHRGKTGGAGSDPTSGTASDKAPDAKPDPKQHPDVPFHEDQHN